jgi:DNA (cytosine-5)-methyltransferase 1
VTDTYALQGSLIGRSDENGPCGKGFKPEQSYTVNTVDKGGAVALCYQQTVSALTTELAHNTGNQGQQGGQLVVENTPVLYQETVGSLCASDWRGIRNQDIGDDKAIVETFGNNGFGKWNEEPATLKANGGDFPGSENVVVENRYAVRSLTTLECLRLQGFPDFWLDNIHIVKPTADDISYWRSAWAELCKKKSDKQIIKWLKDPYSDGNAYKAIGNSLAVPCALWVLRGIVENVSCIHSTVK